MGARISEDDVEKLRGMIRAGDADADIMQKLGVSRTTIYRHRQIADTVPADQRMAKPKPEGGRNDEVRDLEQRLDYYVQRETELLSHIALLSDRYLRVIERIEAFEAEKAEA